MRFLPFFIALMLFSAPSYAIGSIIAVSVLGFASGSIAALAVAGVINFAVSTVVNRIFAPKPPKGNPSGVREQIPPSSTNSLPVVYGDAYLGATFVDAALSQNQKVMYYVMAISSISRNGQFSFDTSNFWYGDRKIAFDTIDRTKVISLTDGNGNVNTKISGKLFINLYTSSASGVITNINGSLSPSQVMSYNAADQNTVPSVLAWPSSNRQMNNIAFAIVKLIYNADAQVTNLSPITFRCSQYLNSTGAAKPGDVWYDYMTNTEYGGAIDTQYVDATSAATANTYSDELITFTNNSGTLVTQPRYRINGVIDTTKPVLENINNIMMACDSWLSFDAANGKWAMIVNKAESASLSFDDSNIIDDIRVSTININQSINQIEAKFPNKLNKDIANYVYLTTPSGLLYPNEPVNKQTTSFDLVNDSVQAQYLANRILEQAREDLIVNIKTTYVGIQAAAGDVVSITNAAYGWTSKLFRVMKVNEASLPDGSLVAQLELNEYNPAVYDNNPITEFATVPNSSIANPGFFPNLNAPTVTDQQPNAAIPSFSVACVLPSYGQVLTASLYYTTVATPTDSDWTLWGLQNAPNSEPFTPSTTLTFQHISLPTGTYYFAFKVGNKAGDSGLSSISTAYVWSPNPTSSAVAGTFLAAFSPAVIQVPYTTSPQFSGIAPQLYGTAAAGSIDFVPAQTDSDASFVNNTWRIGDSSTTGYASILKSNITIGNPSDGGFYALWPQPTAMSAEPAYITVPVRYKSSTGTVTQGGNAILQLVFAKQGNTGPAGASGTQTGTAYLYQWSTSTPSNPSGTSSFVWATAINQTYTGGGGWTTTIPANPGTAGIKLWQASKGVSDVATATSTTVDWTSGYAVKDITQNGANGASGTQSASAIVYQWAATIPSGPTGTSTYTWSSGTFTPTPTGWTLSPGSSIAGYTLWQARVQLVDSATASTSTINWTTASVSAAGYAGANGGSARLMYSRIAGNPTPNAGTVTVTGDAYPSSAQSSAVWGASFAVTWYSSDPNPASNDSLYQSDGVYNPTANQTVWSAPYISALKVGSLSAITTNTGSLNVTGTIQSGTAAISGSTMTGSGAVIYSGGNFAIGNSSRNMSFNGSTLTMNGDLVVTGNIQSDSITQAWTGQLASSVSIFNSTTGLNYAFPSFTVPNSGKLVTSIIAIFHNFSTGTTYKVQAINFVNGTASIGEIPIHLLNSTGSVTAFIPIGPNSVTTGSSQVYTSTEETIVNANDVCQVSIYGTVNTNNSNVYLLDASYVAVLYKR